MKALTMKAWLSFQDAFGRLPEVIEDERTARWLWEVMVDVAREEPTDEARAWLETHGYVRLGTQAPVFERRVPLGSGNPGACVVRMSLCPGGSQVRRLWHAAALSHPCATEFGGSPEEAQRALGERMLKRYPVLFGAARILLVGPCHG